MSKYVIEREIPGAGNIPADTIGELKTMIDPTTAE